MSTTDHDRDAAGLTYVYPVVSRRAGGVSVGVNLNPDNACNWRCAYCQVPDLTRGSAPVTDLARLDAELRGFLDEVLRGDFMAERVPREFRQLRDIAISGNGEPTSSRQFEAVIDLIGAAMADFDLVGRIKLVLITNGSYTGRPGVRRGLEKMRPLGGEVWLKVDAATEAGIRRINGVRLSPARLAEEVEAAAVRCPTWLQTCLVGWDEPRLDEAEFSAYLDFVGGLLARGVSIEGVLLYRPARRIMQPEAARLRLLPEAVMRDCAARIEALGLPVRLSL